MPKQDEEKKKLSHPFLTKSQSNIGKTLTKNLETTKQALEQILVTFDELDSMLDSMPEGEYPPRHTK